MLPFQCDQSCERPERGVDLIAYDECRPIDPVLFQELPAALDLVGEVADLSHDRDC
jgi:hypothetical protein